MSSWSDKITIVIQQSFSFIWFLDIIFFCFITSRLYSSLF